MQEYVGAATMDCGLFALPQQPTTIFTGELANTIFTGELYRNGLTADKQSHLNMKMQCISVWDGYMKFYERKHPPPPPPTHTHTCARATFELFW